MPAVRPHMVFAYTGNAEELSDLQDHVLEHAKEAGQSPVKGPQT